MASDGWIKLHRKTLECPLVMIDADYLAIWVYILLNATHKEIPVIFGKDKIILKPGQLITGYTKIATDLSISRSKVQRVINRYANDMQIDTQTNSKGTLISVINWEKYQLGDTDDDTQVIRNRYASDTQVNTNKNIKNERMKEDNKEITPNGVTKKAEKTSPTFITLPLNDGSEHQVTESDIKTWKELYPKVDVEQQIRNMKGWLLGNPTKRKTARGINKFINTWLAKEQDKGGSNYGSRNGNTNNNRNNNTNAEISDAEERGYFQIEAGVSLSDLQRKWMGTLQS